MHGLYFRALQGFVRDSYGTQLWDQAVAAAGVEMRYFTPFRDYPPEMLFAILKQVAGLLGRPRSEILEDVGIYLVSHPKCRNLRRLLRFGGASFPEFVYSLLEMRERAALAVVGLELPYVTIQEHQPDHLTLTVHDGPPGSAYVIAGLLRAVADDYGALILPEVQIAQNGQESISLRLLDLEYSPGRDFRLAETGVELW